MNMSFLNASKLCRNLIIGTGLVFTLVCSAAPPRNGDVFPALNQFGLEGNVPNLRGKVALVDFWASWCAPCKRSFPVMKELQDKFGSRGFVVVAVCLDEKKPAMDEFLKKNPNAFIVLHDPKGRLAQALAIEKMPTSFLVGTDGKILNVHSGFEGEPTRRAYLAEIEKALATSGKQP
jgi:cytochrome c biogenesis protein CcmG/thiol:disulfide interchange protein DsbE